MGFFSSTLAVFCDMPARTAKIFGLGTCSDLEKMQDLVLLFVVLGSDLKMREA